MPRISKLFSREKARIAFLTAGQCGMDHSLEMAFALIRGGANMLEIGVPFSDPVADGAVIQKASQRSLSNGTTVRDIVKLVEKIREKSDVPLVLFSYLNPILSALKTDFLHNAKQAGLDGLLIVDSPLEESESIRTACLDQEIDLIYVMTPHTPLARIEIINQAGSGFLYYACRSGTTGMRDQLPEQFAFHLNRIKPHVTLPIAVGFGISNRAMVEEALNHADGAVVGSYFVQKIEEGNSIADLENDARDLFDPCQVV